MLNNKVNKGRYEQFEMSPPRTSYYYAMRLYIVNLWIFKDVKRNHKPLLLQVPGYAGWDGSERSDELAYTLLLQFFLA